MAIWIFCILLVTLLYVFLPRALKHSPRVRHFTVLDALGRDEADVHRLTVGYVLASCLLLGGFLTQSVGCSDRRIVERARSVQFEGVAASIPPEDRGRAWIQVVGDPIRGATASAGEPSATFRWAALSHGAVIDLKPEFSGEKIVAYAASCRGIPYAVRLNGVGINLPKGGWIPVGDGRDFQIRIHRSQRDAQGRPMVSDTSIPFRLEVAGQSVTFSSGLDPRPLTTPLVDRQTLGDLLVSAGARGFRAALDDVRDQAGHPILERMVVMRREREDSPVGLIAAFASALPSASPAALPPPSLESPGGTEPSAARVADEDGEGLRLSVVGAAGSTGLLLPAKSASSTDDRLSFRFDPPPSYPIPPLKEREEKGESRELVLASSVGWLSQSGYVFDVGRSDNPVVVKARFRRSPLRLETFGPLASRGGVSGWTDREAAGFALGENGVVPIVRFANPFNGAGRAWLMPLAGIVGGGLILLAVLFGPLRAVSRSPLVFVLWVGTMALLCVRCVLAYRVTTLPPLDIDSLSQGAYRAPWAYARLATLAFGIFGAVGAALLSMGLEREMRAVPGVAELRVSQAGRKGLFGFARQVCYLLALGQAFLVSGHKFFHLRLPWSEPQYLQLGALFLVAGFACAGLSQDWDHGQGARGGVRGPYSPLVQRSIYVGFGILAVLVALCALALRLAPFKFLVAEIGVIMLVCILSHPGRTLRAGAWLWKAALPLAVMASLLADSGSFIYGIPLIVAALVSSHIRRIVRSRSRTGAPQAMPAPTPGWFDLAVVRRPFLGLAAVASLWIVVFGVVVLPLARPMLAQLGRETALGRGSAALEKLSTALPYRLAAGDPKAAKASLMDFEEPGSHFDPKKMRETVMQQWQMGAYVRAAGSGYFAAPLSKVGMNYSTMLSDASFSVFLVGEHGVWAAFWTMGLHILLALVFWSAASRAARSRKRPGNVLGLCAIGGIFGFAAVYMALANLWLVPFTGQNMPLLSLRSRADLLLSFGLIAIGGFLIAFPFGHDDGDRVSAPDASMDRFILAFWAFPTILVFGWFLTLGALLREGGSSREPFNLEDETYNRIVQAFEMGRQERQGVKTLDLADTPSIRAASAFLVPYARAFQAGNESGTPVLRGRLEADLLRSNRRFFFTPSPFDLDEGVPWRGRLLAIPPPVSHELLVAGRDAPMLLTNRRSTDRLTLGGAPPRRDEIDELTFFDDEGANYGGISYNNGLVTLAYDDTGPGKRCRIYVNGVRLALKDRNVSLQPGDVVALRLDSPSGSKSSTVTYVGPRDGRVAAAVWRNGTYRRLFPQGADLPLAYAIGQAADELSSDPKKPLGDLQLSLDLGLQRRLQAALLDWGRANDRATDSARHTVEGLPFTCVAVLDSFSGALRGVAAIPRRDPNEDFEQIQRDFPNASDAFMAARSSWAFQNRTVGSSFKPLSFASLATQLNGPGFDLANVTVNEPAALDGDHYRRLGDLTLSPGVAAAGNNQAGTTMDRYLRDSRTWPAVATATLGLIDDRRRLGDIFHIGQPGGMGYNGQSASLTPRSGLGDAWLAGKRLGSTTVARSLFIQGLLDCYGPNVVWYGRRTDSLREHGLADTFLQPLRLDDPRVTVQSLVCPDPHWANATLLTNFDLQLVRYMFGAGECKWSAVVMAANAARLTTGLRVVPTLGAAVAPEGAMPSPISNADWRFDHILKPLFNISTFSQAGEIREAARRRGLAIAMKSGTIDDGEGSESEMLLFTIGEFRGKEFVPGKSLSGFISIRASKRTSGEGSEMVKGELGKRVFEVLGKYLRP